MTQLQAKAGQLSDNLLKDLTPTRLKGMRRGIEKESLRAQADGALALTPPSTAAVHRQHTALGRPRGNGLRSPLILSSSGISGTPLVT